MRVMCRELVEIGVLKRPDFRRQTKEDAAQVGAIELAFKNGSDLESMSSERVQKHLIAPPPVGTCYKGTQLQLVPELFVGLLTDA